MGNQEKRTKTGRPKKEIDAAQVKQLASIGCTYNEMAAVLGCNARTLQRRFVNAVKEGQERLKASLRRWQYTAAAGGNVTMQIWLGKQFLDQKEPKQVLEHSGEVKGGGNKIMIITPKERQGASRIKAISI